MTFNELYSRNIELWGEVVDFSDGGFIDPKTRIFIGPDFGSKLFFQQWNKIEEVVGHEDLYDNLMVWTFFCVFYERARVLFRQNIFSLNPKQISKQEIEEQFFDGLHEQGMEKELAGYERIID